MSSPKRELLRHKKFNYKNNRRLEIDCNTSKGRLIQSPKLSDEGSSQSPCSATTCESFGSSQGGTESRNCRAEDEENIARNLNLGEYQLVIFESSDICGNQSEPLDLRIRGKKRKCSTSSDEAKSADEEVLSDSASGKVQPRYCKADSFKKSPTLAKTMVYAADGLDVDEHFKKSLGIECYNAIFRSKNQRAMSPYSPRRSTSLRCNRSYEANINRSYPRSRFSSSSDSVSIDSSTSKNLLPWKRFCGQSYGQETVIRDAGVDA